MYHLLLQSNLGIIYAKYDLSQVMSNYILKKVLLIIFKVGKLLPKYYLKSDPNTTVLAY